MSATRNEGPSEREFTMTVMYRINQSLTTRIARYLVSRLLLIVYLPAYKRQMCFICGKTEYRKPIALHMFA